MRKRFVYGSVAFVALSGLVVLGNSTDLVASFLGSARGGQTSTMPLLNTANEGGASSKSSAAKPANRPPEVVSSPTTEIPEHILYDRLFRQIVEFTKLAEDQRAKGESVTAFYGLIEQEIGLNEEQAANLLETATQYVKAVSLVDDEAKGEIEKLRVEHQARNFSKDQLIQPSTKLRKLQEKRDSLTLKYRDALRVVLGNEKFDELDTFVRGDFSTSIKVLPVSTPNPTEDEK